MDSYRIFSFVLCATTIIVSASAFLTTSLPLTSNNNNNKNIKVQQEKAFISSSSSSSSKSNLNEDGECKFGTKQYWDNMYNGELSDEYGRNAKQYSWYCGWDEFKPFWYELVPNKESRIMIPGIGNDPTIVSLYDAGYTNLIAFDYSIGSIERSRALFENVIKNNKSSSSSCSSSSSSIELYHADFTDLSTIPIKDSTIDATLDKGTLDAIYISGIHIFQDSINELTRVTKKGGVVVCISNVIPDHVWIDAFDTDANEWEIIHDGSLAFAPDGEATIDLGANLFSFKRR